jgi:glycosyltransferase involved in cell wall biosynthesis
MKRPQFSIIIPTLNEEKFLPLLLDSLTLQGNKDFEVIVVDGSSKDKTVALARSFGRKLPKLQVIVSPKASLPLQRNVGASVGVGEWFIFIDADSVVMPHFISRVKEYVQKEEACGLFTTWLRPDSENPSDANIALVANLMFEVALALGKPLPSGPLTGVTRKAFESVKGYNEDQEYNEDVDFCFRVAKAGFAIRIIPETLYTWSLRRLRNEGTAKVIQQYILSSLPILFFNRTMKKFPGYTMGGHLYTKKRVVKKSVLKQYEATLKRLINELLE